jgi:NitT/TauT family transport system substrate-binding protein
MRSLAVLVLVLAVGVVGVGCGDDDSGSDSASSGSTSASSEAREPATIKAGILPVADHAWLFLGSRKGFFEEEGLTIEDGFADSRSVVPAVLKGEFDIGNIAITSAIIARSKGLPVRLVSPSSFGGSDEQSAPDAVMVPKGSSITSPKDLEGKTVAVATLNNIGPLTINATLEKEGVDYKQVKYVEVPFPEMPAALEAGRVDAAWVVEPFVGLAAAAGARAVLHPYEGTAPGFPVSGFFASEKWIADNEDVVARFQRAAQKSLEYAAAHPDEARRVVPSYTEIPAAAAKAMVLPAWEPTYDLDDLQLNVDLAAKYGFIEEKPAAEDLVQQPEG